MWKRITLTSTTWSNQFRWQFTISSDSTSSFRVVSLWKLNVFLWHTFHRTALPQDLERVERLLKVGQYNYCWTSKSISSFHSLPNAEYLVYTFTSKSETTPGVHWLVLHGPCLSVEVEYERNDVSWRAIKNLTQY